MSGKFPRLTTSGKLGLGLILVSSLLWLALLVVPFLPLSSGQKALGAAAVVVTAEILFWLGALLTGKEVVQNYRDRLQPKYLWQQLKKLWRKRT
jgi:phosphate/sulfate permease